MGRVRQLPRVRAVRAVSDVDVWSVAYGMSWSEPTPLQDYWATSALGYKGVVRKCVEFDACEWLVYRGGAVVVAGMLPHADDAMRRVQQEIRSHLFKGWHDSDD